MQQSSGAKLLIIIEWFVIGVHTVNIVSAIRPIDI